MSTPTQYNVQPQPPLHMPMNTPMPVQPPKPKPKFNWKLALIGFVVFLLGAAMGTGTVKEPAAVETIKEVEKIVRVEVPVVPPQCKTAFTNAEELFLSAARTSTIFKGAIDAVAIMDVPGINAATEKIKAENAIVEGLGTKYAAAKTTCLAG